MTDILDSEYIAVGSATLNKSIMPTIAAFLTYMKGLSPGGRKAIIFGSYGWGDKTIPEVSRYMEEAKFEVVYTSKIQFVPDQEEIDKLKSDLLQII